LVPEYQNITVYGYIHKSPKPNKQAEQQNQAGLAVSDRNNNNNNSIIANNNTYPSLRKKTT